MAYEVLIADDRSHIVLKLLGAAGRPQFQGVLDAHALGAKEGIHRYLVDLTEATNRDSTLDDYEMAYTDFPAHAVIDRSARVVALVRPGDHSHDFLVTVFRNSGSFVELFDDRAAALRALLAGGEAAPAR